MNPLVAQPQVAARSAEPHSEFVPRTIEEIRVIHVLLDQHRVLSDIAYNKIKSAGRPMYNTVPRSVDCIRDCESR